MVNCNFFDKSTIPGLVLERRKMNGKNPGGVCGVYVKTIPSKAGYAGYVKNKKILKAGGLKRVIAGYWQHN